MNIKNETEYEKASARAEEIFTAKPGTAEYEELKILLKDLKAYEQDFVNMLKGYS
jgi:antitoxin component HigA of HigAB toxin-antitoxin module